MTTEFRLHSPQLTKTIEIEDLKKETTYRSLQVSKSLNVLSEQHDEQTIMIKKKILNQQFSIFNEDLINRNYQQNSSEQEQNNLQTSLNTLRNNEEQQMQSLSNKVCYFCCTDKNLIQICPCSYAHQTCATTYIQTGSIMKRISCQQCKQQYHLKGCIYFNFKKWKESKFSLFLEFLFIAMVVIAVIYTAIILLEQFKTNSNYISTYTKIILLCTVGFIVCVVVISKILQHFKAIKFEVQQYYPRNIEYNIQYLKLLVQD
ncbi:unnamed protein product (macronuclear) [Paramecium tetraurelia]|uniref:RING-CH-type domain-containing protein n=1 Tax=Paramecium tetraurelia TaxID=5888 RepID=A0CHM9_PARTE|nr:uncharacterized protein GSPATT00038398001 [Paramecium tetraurelia]CAK70296.1 unnamed protein product [Paramecium tetraurelia]|eukprot:XP_001437693.1 hypothetical protein (macronuclear) [Paramecium tetraurelia strain d4-2]